MKLTEETITKTAYEMIGEITATIFEALGQIAGIMDLANALKEELNK